MARKGLRHTTNDRELRRAALTAFCAWCDCEVPPAEQAVTAYDELWFEGRPKRP